MPSPEAPRPFGIVDVLRMKIVSGEYPEGAKLPGETALAGQLQASRSAVRRALVELGREGLVSAARGRGTFVRVRPDKRVIVIGDQSPHEDLLDAAYEPTRRGWTPVWPTRTAAPTPASPLPSSAPSPPHPNSPSPASPTPHSHSPSLSPSVPSLSSLSLPPSISPSHQQSQHVQQMQRAQFLRRVTTQVRDARIVGCNSTQAAALGLGLRQPIVLRDQRWRHQENGYVIALSSFAPTSLFSAFTEAPRTPSSGRQDRERPDSRLSARERLSAGQSESIRPGSARLESSWPEDARSERERSARETPTSGRTVGGSRLGGDGDVAVYAELIREYGPVTFSASVKARMPSVREREELEMETGVPLLIVTRMMLDPHGHPLEATLVHVPADRFEVAHASRKPVLSL